MAEIVTGARAPSVADVGAVSPAKIFWATWFGWMLDGFDSSMYGYILPQPDAVEAFSVV